MLSETKQTLEIVQGEIAKREALRLKLASTDLAGARKTLWREVLESITKQRPPGLIEYFERKFVASQLSVGDIHFPTVFSSECQGALSKERVREITAQLKQEFGIE